MESDEKLEETTSAIVSLSVGGMRFQTTKSTLGKSGFFNVMLSGKFGDKQKDGSYFIDRSGYYFKYLLDYMRCGYVSIPSKEAPILQLEAQFYQIDLDLKEIIQSMKLPELEVCISLLKILINGKKLRDVYQHYKISDEDHKKRYDEYDQYYTNHNFLIRHLTEKCGYCIYQKCSGDKWNKTYILRTSVSDTVLITQPPNLR